VEATSLVEMPPYIIRNFFLENTDSVNLLMTYLASDTRTTRRRRSFVVARNQVRTDSPGP
jgi:hypothetical protein